MPPWHTLSSSYLCVVEILAPIVMINRPNSVVSVDEEIVGDQVVLLEDGGASRAVLDGVWVSISMA